MRVQILIHLRMAKLSQNAGLVYFVECKNEGKINDILSLVVGKKFNCILFQGA